MVPRLFSSIIVSAFRRDLRFRRNTYSPRGGHDFRVIGMQIAPSLNVSIRGHPMPTVMVRATTILGEFEQVQAELIGKAVILSDGKAGTVETVWLDELHGLRISIRGHDGKWPVATIKLVQPH
jgi:hypothetical protein